MGHPAARWLRRLPPTAARGSATRFMSAVSRTSLTTQGKWPLASGIYIDVVSFQ